MRSVPLHLEQLYDGTGRHIGGIYPPLAVNNVLMPEHDTQRAVRPFSRCIHGTGGPTDILGLVWMMPVPGCGLPLMISLDALGAIVQTLDRGELVLMHSDDEKVLRVTEELAAVMMGGGHA